MGVLQLPIPVPPPKGSTGDGPAASASANNNANVDGTTFANNNPRISTTGGNGSPTGRNTPSPVRSVMSSNTFSTTPVISNLASGSFLMNANNNAKNYSANNNVPSVSIYNGVHLSMTEGGVSGGVGGISIGSIDNHAQSSIPYTSQRPASLLQMSSHQMHQPKMGANNGPVVYPSPSNNNIVSQQNIMNMYNMNQRGISQQSGMIPHGQSNFAMNNNSNINPPWTRMGVGGQGMVTTTTMSGGRLINNSHSNTSNLLGTVTVGGSAMAGANVSRLANNQSTNLLGPGAGMNSRNRIGGTPTLPQLLPMTSASLLTGRTAAGYPQSGEMASSKEHQYPQQRTIRGIQSTPRNKQTGVAGTPTAQHHQSKMVDFEDYGLGNDDPADTLEYDPGNPSLLTPEVALTSGLVTLSVHEALTFDGVELALHPDVFSQGTGKKSNGKGVVDGKEDSSYQRLRPGDLVEIKVWSVRPGVSVENSSVLNSNPSSSLKSKIPPIPRPSLHSRNTSLATVNSSLSNTSMTATPRSVLAAHSNVISNQPPPLPKIVGGDGLSTSLSTSFGASPSSAPEDGQVGQNSVRSTEDGGDARSGVLHGEHLLETPKEELPATNGPNISSVFAGAASSLFSKMAGGQDGNSDDNTSVSTSGALHSRDSSLILTTSASWMNALHISNSRDETPQISPSLTTTMGSVNEGLPQPHPLITNLSQHGIDPSNNSQVLPMRRDGPRMTSSLVGPPPHPLTQSISSAAPSGTSTPSSHPSSPKTQMSTPVSTPPTNALARKNISTSIHKNTPSSVQQRPPLGLQNPPDTLASGREQGKSITGSPTKSITGSPTKIAGTVLSPEPANFDKKSLLIDSSLSDPRQRASTTDAPSSSDLPPTHTQHNRNNSIAMTGILTLGNSNAAPTHRRFHSNVTAISDTTPPAQISHKVTLSKAKDDNPTKDINDVLQGTHFVKVSFMIPVSEGSLSSIKSGARTQVSLLRQVADLYNITTYDTVTVTQITRSKAPFVQQSIGADFLTMTFKDQFVSRGDMYKFGMDLLKSWVYEGKRLTFNGIRTNTKGDHVIRSGLISEDTKLTFRSRSARIIWLVQMSTEMWDFASPYEAVTGNQTSHDSSSSCKIYFDKFIDFVRRLFNKWKRLQLSHNLTVVFFSRTYIRHQDGDKEGSSTPKLSQKGSSAVHLDSDGRMFEDHYKIVIENEVNADYDTLIHQLKKEFVQYPRGVNWNLARGQERTPSTASQGNILEAINITLNLLHLHYIDRDLHRTGNSIVIITPGNGVFEISKNLAGITKQRMMDNGIGSDMLSLGLPPLHVAPFFLYKEKSTSSAEEIQGFDDWKTFFEVPHWMNLSFVDYDNEETEPMLYKEHINDEEDDASVIQAENETLNQTWCVSNGFLQRSTNSETVPKIKPIQASLSRHYKHLISDRGFGDILQACRPRSRGDFGSGLPVSLTTLLRKTAPNIPGSTHATNEGHPQKPNLDREHLQLSSLGDVGRLTPQRMMHHSRSKYLEWGAVNFDEFTQKGWNNSQQYYNRSLSGSQSSPASSFTSISSYRFPSHILFGSSHLQSTTSLDGGGQSVSSGGEDNHAVIHKKHLSNGSMTSLDNEDAHDDTEFSSLENIQKLMADYDTNTFSRSPHTTRAKNKGASQGPVEVEIRSSFNNSFCPGSPSVLEGRAMLRSKSAMFPAVKNKGGIEAALVQYDGTRQTKEHAVTTSNYGFPSNIPTEEVAGRSNNLAVSPLSIGMPYSLDRRSEGLRPSVMRLVAPDAIPRASRFGNALEGFQPLDSRRNSFHTSQIKLKSKEVAHDNKSLGQATKESRLGDRHNSQRATKLIENGAKNNEHKTNSVTRAPHQQTADAGASGDSHHHSHAISPQRVKSKKQQGRKHRHHHSYRRRKPWVLNPFRQEDEDKVLAKTTHNRRRWSHVFPLGEDEFKRHAGPNWKSLCQPAILPMTIDFHPSPQDLEDQAKFTVKQYSVTLPPMDETTYASHAELLQDLVMQRMRQDFQIVPRNIIQSTRRDVTENTLEATLSMGHKIQRLSYNSSSDSVDVVQYYARFAEDETPQTYRYLLWSALRQDYVNVFQTFNKYTLPYKWNELDMLIGGDAVTTIMEGMRYPRISFVIIPDSFVDSQQEKEYVAKFQRLVEYFSKIQPKDDSKNIKIEMHTENGTHPQASSGDKRFIVDLRKKRDDKYEWMELVHDSNCDTRRTFRMTMQWLVAVASKIDQQAQLLHRRCSQYGLKLVSVPHFSCLKQCFMNPFAVPITIPIRNKTCVDLIEKALTMDFDFVYDGHHMSDPNEIDCLDGFDFVVNKWSLKKRKKFVPARQYLHRTGALFARLLRDTKGCAIIIIYLNQRHIGGDSQLLQCARTVFHSLEKYISETCKTQM